MTPKRNSVYPGLDYVEAAFPNQPLLVGKAAIGFIGVVDVDSDKVIWLTWDDRRGGFVPVGANSMDVVEVYILAGYYTEVSQYDGDEPEATGTERGEDDEQTHMER